MDNKEVVKTGITFGSALAIAISWHTNQSIIWAIIHGFFSWLYVVYFAVTRTTWTGTPGLTMEDAWNSPH